MLFGSQVVAAFMVLYPVHTLLYTLVIIIFIKDSNQTIHNYLRLIPIYISMKLLDEHYQLSMISSCIIIFIVCIVCIELESNVRNNSKKSVELFFGNLQIFAVNNYLINPSFHLLRIVMFWRYLNQIKSTKSIQKQFNEKKKDMNKEIIISIILCTFNEGKLLVNSVQSILKSIEYFKLHFTKHNSIKCQFVIADSNSTDGSIKT